MAIGPKKRLKRPAKVTQPANTNIPELDYMLKEMKAIQTDWAEGKSRFLALEQAALDLMKSRGIDTYVRPDGKKATPVYGATETVDWPGIRRAIGPKLWKKILGLPQPDKSKLEALMELGEVKVETVKPFVIEKPSKPYIRF